MSLTTKILATTFMSIALVALIIAYGPTTEAQTSGSIDISGLGTSMEEGDDDSFTVRASNLDSLQSYSIRVTTSNRDIGFNSSCSSTFKSATVPFGSTSYSTSFTLYGCDTSGGTVTANLLRSSRFGSETVDTDSQFVSVTAPTPTPPPPPTPTPTPTPPPPPPPPDSDPEIDISGLVRSMKRGLSDGFTVRASDLDSSQSYSIRVTTSNSGIGFNSSCSDRQEDATAPSGSTSYSTSFTLYGCAVSDGMMTATLLRSSRFGTVTVDTDSQSVSVTAESITISGLVSSMDVGDSDGFTVRASELDSAQDYSIEITTSNRASPRLVDSIFNIGFNSSCSDTSETATVPDRRTSYNASFTLHGCNPPAEW